MRIAYFVHDLCDPAVGRRVRMLTAAGAEVTVLGFRRGDIQSADVEGAPAFDLGRTYDARLLHRTWKAVERRTDLGVGGNAVRDADVLLARNLEMLAIAHAAQRRHAPKAALVYECLDIHRLMLSNSAAGRLLRLAERRLMRNARLLIVSSPAFVSQYFQPKQGVCSSGLPALVVENKVLDLGAPSAGETLRPADRLPGPPWRIGWFGMIRCRKSLELLCELAKRNPGLVEIVIRGRPARTEFDSFDEQVARSPGVQFGGPYGPAELHSLYGNVHFNWAIDYFEEGANSALLLPNRIYEGGRCRVIPIALTHTETGAWLNRRGMGVLLDSPEHQLHTFFRNLTAEAYCAMRRAVDAQPMRTFAADSEDCRRLLQALALASRNQAARNEGASPVQSETLSPVSKG